MNFQENKNIWDGQIHTGLFQQPYGLEMICELGRKSVCFVTLDLTTSIIIKSMNLAINFPDYMSLSTYLFFMHCSFYITTEV
jgi:hypothetical protein